jgi:hypothetical protein
MPDARKGRLARIASFVWRRKVPLLVASAVFLIAFTCFVIWPLCTSPDGRYDASLIAADGVKYWELNDGQMFLVIEEANLRRKVGEYSKLGDGRWVFRDLQGAVVGYLVPGLTRLRVFDTAGNEENDMPFEREWAHYVSERWDSVMSSLEAALMNLVQE